MSNVKNVCRFRIRSGYRSSAVSCYCVFSIAMAYRLQHVMLMTIRFSRIKTVMLQIASIFFIDDTSRHTLTSRCIQGQQRGVSGAFLEVRQWEQLDSLPINLCSFRLCQPLLAPVTLRVISVMQTSSIQPTWTFAHIIITAAGGFLIIGHIDDICNFSSTGTVPLAPSCIIITGVITSNNACLNG